MSNSSVFQYPIDLCFLTEVVPKLGIAINLFTIPFIDDRINRVRSKQNLRAGRALNTTRRLQHLFASFVQDHIEGFGPRVTCAKRGMFRTVMITSSQNRQALGSVIASFLDNFVHAFFPGTRRRERAMEILSEISLKVGHNDRRRFLRGPCHLLRLLVRDSAPKKIGSAAHYLQDFISGVCL